ncbi:hypothetical protein [Terrimonas ginsenosidimutans]|nr:hypothetical protein [Terrimonas ginsenosidimutans]
MRKYCETWSDDQQKIIHTIFRKFRNYVAKTAYERYLQDHC